METLSRAVATFLLNLVWQAPLIAVLAALLALALRRAPARQQHVLWAAALILSVLLPLWSVWPVIRQPVAPVEQAGPAVAGVETAMPAQAPAASRLVSLAQPLSYALAALYLLFLCHRAARLALAWRRTRQIAASARRQAWSDTLQACLARCGESLNVWDIPVLSSALVTGPVTVGARRPVVLFPESLTASPAEWTAALAHELAHIRRRDYLFNLIYEVLYLPVSIHPAAMLLKRKVEESRELACDELVAERVLEPSAYARSLVAMAGASAALARPGYSLGVFDSNILRERVRRLLAKRKTRVPAPALLASAAVLLVLAVAAGASAFSLQAIRPDGAGLFGTVFDPSGAVVPAAAISLRDLETGRKLTAVTNDPGRFAFSRLSPGRYELQVRKRGFRVHRRTPIVLTYCPVRVDAILRLGTVQESLTVHGN